MTKQEAIKELKILKEDYWDDDGYGHETKQYVDTILALDMAINALQQEPKHGKWIDDDPINHKYHRCSCCGTGYFNWGSDVYCRNCGARMESDTE